MVENAPVAGDETYDTGFRHGRVYLDAVTESGGRLAILEEDSTTADEFCTALTAVLRAEPFDFDPTHEPTLIRLQKEGFVETDDGDGTRRAALLMHWYHDHLPPYTDGEVVADGLGFSVRLIPTAETRERAEEFTRDLQKLGDGPETLAPADIRLNDDGELIEIVPPDAIDPSNRAEYQCKMEWLYRLRTVLESDRDAEVTP